MQPDPLVHQALLAQLAQEAAESFDEKHLSYASPQARFEVRCTVEALVESAVLTYLDRVAQKAREN